MRLTAVAILRNDIVEHRGFKSHYELRQALGDADPMHTKPGDIDGFITDTGQFFSRRSAVRVAVEAGQLPESWNAVRRDLLSSDLNWNAKRERQTKSPSPNAYEYRRGEYRAPTQHSDSLLRMLGKKPRRA